MTHPTDEELDALDAKLASQIGDDVAVIFNHEYLFKQARIAITALRAQLADARADLAFMTENRNKWQDSATQRWFRIEKANSRAVAASQPADPVTNTGCCQAPSPPEHYDDYCIRQFAKLMSEKMAASRAKGRSGWHNPEECSVEYLRSLLYEHLDKGDPVDVANFCMMLRHYNASTYREFCNCTPKPAPMTLAERDDLRAKQNETAAVLESLLNAVDDWAECAPGSNQEIAATGPISVAAEQSRATLAKIKGADHE